MVEVEEIRTRREPVSRMRKFNNYYSEQMVDILLCAKEFYAFQAIDSILLLDKQYNSFRHSHARWLQDMEELRANYTEKFAQAIFDYTVMAVAGELRHVRNKASFLLESYPYESEYTRNHVFYYSIMYRAQDILRAGVRMFDPMQVDWNKGYGGAPWFQIAKAGLLKGTVEDGVFIDHCLDLSHNNNVYFDKGAGIFYLGFAGHTSPYQSFLTLKRYCEPQRLIWEPHGREFNRILERANNLGIITFAARQDMDHPAQDKAERIILNYKPQEWGNERVELGSLGIIENYCYSEDSRRRSNSDRWIIDRVANAIQEAA